MVFEHLRTGAEPGALRQNGDPFLASMASPIRTKRSSSAPSLRFERARTLREAADAMDYFCRAPRTTKRRKKVYYAGE